MSDKTKVFLVLWPTLFAWGLLWYWVGTTS